MPNPADEAPLTLTPDEAIYDPFEANRRASRQAKDIGVGMTIWRADDMPRNAQKVAAYYVRNFVLAAPTPGSVCVVMFDREGRVVKGSGVKKEKY